MEPMLLAVTVWGFALGAAMIPVYVAVHRGVVTRFNPGGAIARTILVFGAATLLACAAFAALLLGSGYLFGFIPLKGQAALFFAGALAAGGLVVRVLIEIRKRAP